MYNISVHKRINQIISLLYFIGIWHDDNCTDWHKLASNISFLVTYGSFPISLVGEALISEIEAESIYLANLSIISFVMTVRLYYLLRKKGEILGFIQQCGTHSINNSRDFNLVNKTVDRLDTFFCFFASMTTVASLAVISQPIFSSEKKLKYSIFLPLNWIDNEVIYLVVFLFITYQSLLTCVLTTFNFITWYLMLSCAIKYQILGNEFRNMSLVNEVKTEALKHNLFPKELIVQIKYHRHLQGMTSQFKMCFSSMFLIQMVTSGISICGSVCGLAFHSAFESPTQYGINVFVLVYSLFDIFVVTYFGNEIKLWSSRLSYCLYESNWTDQSEPCKKCVFILMEVLKRPQELVIGKLYPLNLEIFTKILNFAYSMFNMLIKLN